VLDVKKTDKYETWFFETQTAILFESFHGSANTKPGWFFEKYTKSDFVPGLRLVRENNSRFHSEVSDN